MSIQKTINEIEDLFSVFDDPKEQHFRKGRKSIERLPNKGFEHND